MVQRAKEKHPDPDLGTGMKSYPSLSMESYQFLRPLSTKPHQSLVTLESPLTQGILYKPPSWILPSQLMS